MSPIDTWIGMKGYRVLRWQHKPQLAAIIEPRDCPLHCSHCRGERLHSKGRYRRRVQHLRSFGAPVDLVVECRRFQCLECGRSFVQPLPGIRPGRHSSEPLRERIYHLHQDGICGSRLAHRMEMGSATIERIYHQFTVRKARERRDHQCPLVLGIDEHTLHKGCRFATTFCDLRNHSIFDVAEGRSSKDLERFLSGLQGRERVRLICIDMSNSYRALIRRYFPRARIVADRFHVVRIIYHHFMELFRSIVPDLNHHRGKLAALRKRPDRLTDAQRQRLQDLFTQYPALRPLYDQMRSLCELICQRSRTRKACRPLARQLLRITSELAQCGFAPLATLAKTLSSWSEEIACMWRFTKNNGITEGFHRKMKLIQRRAYGFRNFNNYRLRVLAQCS